MSNPAPIGKMQTVSPEYSDSATADVTVENIIRGDEAWKLIQAANMFNEAPENGYEYLLAK